MQSINMLQAFVLYLLKHDRLSDTLCTKQGVVL
jgi:hypothetical protein